MTTRIGTTALIATVLFVSSVNGQTDEDNLVFPQNRVLLPLLNLTEDQKQLGTELHIEYMKQLTQAIDTGKSRAFQKSIRTEISKRFTASLSLDQLSIAKQYNKYRRTLPKGHSVDSFLNDELIDFLEISEHQQSRIKKIQTESKDLAKTISEAEKDGEAEIREKIQDDLWEIFLPHQRRYFEEHFGEIIDATGKSYMELSPYIRNMAHMIANLQNGVQASVNGSTTDHSITIIFSNGVNAKIRFPALVEVLSKSKVQDDLDLTANQKAKIADLRKELVDRYKGIRVGLSTNENDGDQLFDERLKSNDIKLHFVESDDPENDRKLRNLLNFSAVEQKKLDELYETLGKTKSKRAKQLYRQFREGMTAPMGILTMHPGMQRLVELTDDQKREIRELKLRAIKELRENSMNSSSDIKQSRKDAYLDSIAVLNKQQLEKLEKATGMFLYPREKPDK